MFKNQRHKEIIEILKAEGFASVNDLSRRLYASQPTIRRDLILLEQMGYVRRNHGGAILADGKINTPVLFRKGTKPKEKAQICRLAATLIEPDSLIFIDASTTVAYLADFIKASDGVTVVSNGLPLCRALAQKQIRTFSTGGRLLKDSEAFVGRLAETAVREFYADLLFFSSSALNREGMISDYSEEETALRRVMLSRSKRSALLIEAGKFDGHSPFCAFPLSEVDYVVTNMELPSETIDRFGLFEGARDGEIVIYQKNLE